MAGIRNTAAPLRHAKNITSEKAYKTLRHTRHITRTFPVPSLKFPFLMQPQPHVAMHQCPRD
eukprot:1094889-Pelagomonas_calceolata.AAC.11